MPDMEITLLGTGSPLPSGNRCGAGQLVVSDGNAVLIDCGWGAARRLIATGFPIGTIDHLFFTHMHSDHITDLPDFLMMRWTLGASMMPLNIYGPEGTREAVEGFRSALNPDVRYRVAHHGEKLSRTGIDVIVHEVPATAAVSHITTTNGIDIGSFEVDHRPVVPALGFKAQARGRSVVFSGDTVKVQSLVDAAKGADMLISEAVHLGLMQDRITMLKAASQDRMAQILKEACDYHAPTMDVAEMAREAGVGQLVLSHLIPPIPNDGPTVDRFIEGMSEVYKGPLTVGQDMQKLTLGD